MKKLWEDCDEDGRKVLKKMGLTLVLLILANFLTGVAAVMLYGMAYLIIGFDVLKEAVEGLKGGKVFNENTLMAIATIGAFAIKQYPEAVFVMFFYKIGELFEDIAVKNSRSSITALLDIRPDHAWLKLGNAVKETSPEKIKVGDVIVVKPGEKVPLDGIVTDGSAYLDTAALTGETKPSFVKEGDKVLSGTICKNSTLEVRVEKEYGESTVAKILEMVENASEKKAPAENFITQFSKIYTPLVVFGAILLATIPPLFFGGAFTDWLYRALVFLVISCPCALVISIPLSFFGGIGAASRAGVLVKGSNYLEALTHVKTFVFDKTGTLTKGKFAVTKVLPNEGVSETELVFLAACCEQFSPHPIARSIVDYYDGELKKGDVSDSQELVGLGVSANHDGKTIYCGNAKLMKKVLPETKLPESEIGTQVYVAYDGKYVGSLEVADVIKEDSKEAVSDLRAAGVQKIVMLTGDARKVGEGVARELGLDDVKTELLPQDKLEEVEKLKTELDGQDKLAFVGDGLNDTPVLAQSDVGIAMGALGSDAAVEAADVVLMSDEPSAIVRVMKIARRTKRIVWENISFALGVKAVCLLLGALGIAGMWQAVFADVGVTVIAVLNSLRVLYGTSKRA
ncbi:heavy metal translocating P-type ATPase [Ligilactobacillus ruminis]|uniref:Cd(2+)-exporting ATPase n=1 Tax=Ligilactobacillus ruminis TaxID=1623 RepID=A0A6A8GUN4_9LACO|nr:heavy metal translocating P-type ATPase [Ligilactobacillus ruminis]MSA21321.1 cadmium-translocating P-type ATPase [Ligilactobacillus ruminis]MSA22211.1 cadmium-translocating P-type ATPase [Ligilactobacillus ruminis]MSA25048.1 cadmium-translocating P-type ATPase [Ligilactobacillus ruminis]MSA35750.1 cadmium-translocating P-type ATPase [Ligilactobacillus ruminis]MSA42177.1 cadmium-translocating P-type ATPase [Ligilactobacillus ruminis]